MAGILDSVDQRTRLVGQNRLEILMFRLGGRQKFAINVFKVQEVVQLPKMTLMPHRHSSVCGVVNLRGQTLPVVDLSRAIGLRPLVPDERSTIIVTEYNRTVQAFLVGGVDRIVNLNWEEVMPPPTTAGRQHYLTSITRAGFSGWRRGPHRQPELGRGDAAANHGRPSALPHVHHQGR